MDGLLSALLLACTFGLGWVWQAATIEVECTKLNSFYVGKNVYDCKLRNKSE
jgi:hypothetical protein